MYSLSYVLTDQHGDELAPFRCNAQTVSRLIRYFEDIVTENRLSALVIEGRCLDGEMHRETERLTTLSSAARHLYLFSCDPTCPTRTWNPEKSPNITELEEKEYHSIETGPFILVMDQRFTGLLASYRIGEEEPHSKTPYELIWTFDSNVVFTGIEYLMARIGVQKPWERSRLESLLNTCTPHSSSIRLSLAFTTKLAMLLHRQNELETAINSISSAISSTLELDRILQSAVEEVGRALKARRAALVLWEEQTRRPESLNVYEREDDDADFNSGGGVASFGQERRASVRVEGSDSVMSAGSFEGGSPQVEARANGVAKRYAPPNAAPAADAVTPGPIEVPITYTESIIGVLAVEDDTPGRVWESEEMLMVRTVSDQLAVAISHARLFKQVKTQAMTDALTGLNNHRYFQDRLEREIKLAERNNENVSLILLDLDHLKWVNDSLGHRAGDECLIHVASVMKASVREVDVCARYGGEEFVVVLPQCQSEHALEVAERLRRAIAESELPRIGRVTASIGVATFPNIAKTKEELIEMADRAMYLAKAAGRNSVRTLNHQTVAGMVNREN